MVGATMAWKAKETRWEWLYMKISEKINLYFTLVFLPVPGPTPSWSHWTGGGARSPVICVRNRLVLGRLNTLAERTCNENLIRWSNMIYWIKQWVLGLIGILRFQIPFLIQTTIVLLPFSLIFFWYVIRWKVTWLKLQLFWKVTNMWVVYNKYPCLLIDSLLRLLAFGELESN